MLLLLLNQGWRFPGLFYIDEFLQHWKFKALEGRRKKKVSNYHLDPSAKICKTKNPEVGQGVCLGVGEGSGERQLGSVVL